MKAQHFCVSIIKLDDDYYAVVVVAYRKKYRYVFEVALEDTCAVKNVKHHNYLISFFTISTVWNWKMVKYF